MKNNSAPAKNKKTSKLKLFLVIAGVFAILAIISSLLDQPEQQNSDTNVETETSESDAEQAATNTAKLETVNEDEAEQFCQDAGLLKQYIDLDDYSIISIMNYNLKYLDSYSYDKDGYAIKYLQWNGKNKDTHSDVKFSCWISGPKDSVTLHWMSIDGVDRFGSAGFESYDENGKLMQ